MKFKVSEKLMFTTKVQKAKKIDDEIMNMSEADISDEIGMSESDSDDAIGVNEADSDDGIMNRIESNNDDEIAVKVK